MRYHTEQPETYTTMYGRLYKCNHPIYSRCTLYSAKGVGFAVIQQRYDRKMTFWTEIDPWLIDIIYLNPNFNQYFEKIAKPRTDGLYPTVTVRQLMWALKMKPMKREVWETTFDHSPF